MSHIQFSHELNLALQRWMKRRVSYHPEAAPGGWWVLRYHRQYGVMMWICMGGFLAMLVSFWLAGVPSGLRIFGTTVFGSVMVAAALELWSYRRRALLFSDLGLQYVPAFARAFVFSWDEIAAFEISENEEKCVLRLADGRKAEVDAMMNGFGQFLEGVCGKGR